MSRIKRQYPRKIAAGLTLAKARMLVHSVGLNKPD
jgi:hypothetical protein